MRTTLLATLSLTVAALTAACGDDSATTPTAAGAGGATSSTTATASSASSTGVGGSTMLPASFTVSGTVVDQDGAPVEGAFVLQGGRSHEAPLTTPADGSFTLDISYDGLGTPAVVATKQGYRTRGFEFFSLPSGPVQLVVHAVEPPDNVGYLYGAPGQGDDQSTAFCGHCHNLFTKQFQTSAHSRAAEDPLVQDLYAGVSRAHSDAGSCTTAGGVWRAGLQPGSASTSVDKCYLGSGVLPDLNGCGGPAALACDDPALPSAQQPTSFGACADCHAPGMDGPAGGRNLHDAVGVGFEDGVHCDLCHKVAEVDMSKAAGVAGRLRIQRPGETIDGLPGSDLRQVMFGPLLDVANQFMGGSYQPQFSEATFCGGCHQYEQGALIGGDVIDTARWPNGLPVHSTYAEWQASSYNGPDTQCQLCHMPEETTLASSADVATAENSSIVFGFLRPASQIRSHAFRGPLDGTPRLIDGAVALGVQLTKGVGSVTADVSIGNIGAGHALPTGEPLRSLILLVTVQGTGCSQPPRATGGMTVNDVGGARAIGVVGTDVTVNGTLVDWVAGAAVASVGQHLRVVRPSGSYDDYAAVGLFDTLSAADKGLEIHLPVADPSIMALGAGQLTLDVAPTVSAGDVVYLVDALAVPSDGDASRAFAGAPGYSFARVMVDAGGARMVPHHRAIDIVSDNRIPPGAAAATQHVFDTPAGCSAMDVTATLLYRPVPLLLGEQRGWGPVDHVIASSQANVALP
jgi:hypothetical protein